MARIAPALVRSGAELRRRTVGEAARRPEELILPRSLPVGHGGLNEVAHAVELVVVPEVGEGPVHAVDDVVGIQVAALVLGGADQVNGLVRRPLQLRVRVLGEGVGRGLDPLGEVGILEHIADLRPDIL